MDTIKADKIQKIRGRFIENQQTERKPKQKHEHIMKEKYKYTHRKTEKENLHVCLNIAVYMSNLFANYNDKCLDYYKIDKYDGSLWSPRHLHYLYYFFYLKNK